MNIEKKNFFVTMYGTSVRHPRLFVMTYGTSVRHKRVNIYIYIYRLNKETFLFLGSSQQHLKKNEKPDPIILLLLFTNTPAEKGTGNIS